MNKHFQYLVDEPRNHFFQKIARSRLEELVPPVGPDLNKPAPRGPSFAKVAMRLDGDLVSLEKVAAPGTQAGMIKRAMDYFSVVCDHVTMDETETKTLFEKCASFGIERDVAHARAELQSLLPEPLHVEMNADLNKLAFELAQHAVMVKESFIPFGLMAGRVAKGAVKGVGKGLSWAGGKAVRGGELARGFGKQVTGGLAGSAESLAAKGKAGMGALKGKWYNWRAGGQAAKAERAAADIAKLEQKGLARGTSVGAAAQRGGAMAERDMLLQRQQKALQKKQEFTSKAKGGAEQEWQGIKGQVSAGTGFKPEYTGKSGRRGVTGATESAEAATKTKPMPPAQTTTQKPPTEGATSAAGAAEKKGPMGVVDESGNVRPAGKGKGKGTGTEGPEPAVQPKPAAAGAPPVNAPAAVKEDPKLWDSFKKFTDGQPITPAEKGALIRAGIKGAVGYRVVMGQGAISGGEGLI